MNTFFTHFLSFTLKSLLKAYHNKYYNYINLKFKINNSYKIKMAYARLIDYLKLLVKTFNETTHSIDSHLDDFLIKHKVFVLFR